MNNKNISRLRVKEVSSILWISESAVYALIHRGKLPYYRFGRSIRIDGQELAEFMERNHWR